MIAVHHVLRGDAFLLGADGDGHSVFVGAADEDYIFLFQSQVADINVGRNINACQVSDMNRAVGIRQCRGHGGTFEFLDICISFVMNAFSGTKIAVFCKI